MKVYSFDALKVIALYSCSSHTDTYPCEINLTLEMSITTAFFFFDFHRKLRPSINGMVTHGNTKLCCRGFVLLLFRSTTAYKIDFEHTRDYMKLFSVC